MSFEITVSIGCNRCKNRFAGPTLPGAFNEAQFLETENIAKRYGWLALPVNGTTLHLCPDCATHTAPGRSQMT